MTDTVQAFAARNNDKETEFLLAAGSAGIEAATNIVVKQAMRDMLFWVYGAVIVLCYLTFRSWRAVVVAVLPSVLCEALMVGLGVGIGVDYALYVLSVTLSRMRAGDTLSQAYLHALQFTGRVLRSGDRFSGVVAGAHGRLSIGGLDGFRAKEPGSIPEMSMTMLRRQIR